jgi:antitoxin VapB
MVASTLFTNDRTQAVRLPADTKRMDVRAKGHERIIAPLNQSWDSFFKDGLQATDDFMSERASQEQAAREGF